MNTKNAGVFFGPRLVKRWVIKADSISVEEWEKLLSKIQIFLINKSLFRGFLSSKEYDQYWFSFVVDESALSRVEGYIKSLGLTQILDKRPEPVILH